MKFDSTKSMSRNRPPNGTADLDRSRVSGWSRSPLPPAMIIARTRARRGIALNPARTGPRPTPGRGRGSKSPRARGEPTRHLGEALEVGVVLGHAPLGVVARGARRDQELPVGRLEQQELARRLREHAGEVALGRAPGGEMRRPLGFGAVDAVPRPFGVAVEPDTVIAALAPTPFGQGERRARRDPGERLAERRRRHTAAHHLAGDVLEPERALEPPVTEELRVVGRADERWALGGGLGERGRHELDEVTGLEADLLDGERRLILELAAEVAGVVRDAPEA